MRMQTRSSTADSRLVLKSSMGKWLLFGRNDTLAIEVDGQTGRLMAERIDSGQSGALPPELDRALRDEGYDDVTLEAIDLRQASDLIDCEVQLTERCNLRCAHCFVERAGRREIDRALFQGICDDLKRLGAVNLILTGGELFLLEDLEAYLRAAAQAGLNVRLITNGTRVDGRAIAMLKAYRVTEVSVSIDGNRPEHDAVRGRGRFEQSAGAVRQLSLAGVNVLINTVVHRGNIERLEGFAADCLEGLGVSDISYSRFKEYRRAKGSAYAISDEEWARFLQRLGVRRNSGERWVPVDVGLPCGAGRASLGIGADGSVAPCFVLDEFPMGNVNDRSLEEIYRAPEPRAASVLGMRPSAELRSCARCAHWEACLGGCRGNAVLSGSLYGPDRQACAVFTEEMQRQASPEPIVSILA